jgi:hypothetical protein
LLQPKARSSPAITRDIEYAVDSWRSFPAAHEHSV